MVTSRQKQLCKVKKKNKQSKTIKITGQEIVRKVINKALIVQNKWEKSPFGR